MQETSFRYVIRKDILFHRGAIPTALQKALRDAQGVDWNDEYLDKFEARYSLERNPGLREALQKAYPELDVDSIDAVVIYR